MTSSAGRSRPRDRISSTYSCRISARVLPPEPARTACSASLRARDRRRRSSISSRMSGNSMPASSNRWRAASAPAHVHRSRQTRNGTVSRVWSATGQESWHRQVQRKAPASMRSRRGLRPPPIAWKCAHARCLALRHAAVCESLRNCSHISSRIRAIARTIYRRVPNARRGHFHVPDSQSRSADWKASGCSYCGTWPAPAIST